MAKRQPKRPLSAHADAEDPERSWPQPPPSIEERDDLTDDEFLRRQHRIELGADAVEPPAALPMRTNARQASVGKRAGVGCILSERFETDAMQEDESEARLARRIEHIGLLAADQRLGPPFEHETSIRLSLTPGQCINRAGACTTVPMHG